MKVLGLWLGWSVFEEGEKGKKGLRGGVTLCLYLGNVVRTGVLKSKVRSGSI